MLIRAAQVSDAQALADAESRTAAQQEGLLAARPYEIPVSAFEQKIARLQTDGLYVVAELQGQLVGHLLLEPFGLQSIRHVAQLTIVVHPGFTGQGIGRTLLKHAIAWASAAPEILKIELRVRSTNARAIHLYESLGFQHEGCLKSRIRLSEGFVDDLCMGLFVGQSS